MSDTTARLKACTDAALEGVISALQMADRPGAQTLVAMRTSISKAMADALDLGIEIGRVHPPESITETRPGFRARR